MHKTSASTVHNPQWRGRGYTVLPISVPLFFLPTFSAGREQADRKKT
jgi:hypothetical protein